MANTTVRGDGLGLNGVSVTSGAIGVVKETEDRTFPEAANDTLEEILRAPDAGAVLGRLTVRTADGLSTSASGTYTLEASRVEDGGSTTHGIVAGGSTGTITDASVSAHTVVKNGDADVDGTVTNVTNGAISFDGTGDYLSVAASDDMDFEGRDFTVECWVNPTTIVGSDRIIAQAGASDLDRWVLYIDGTTSKAVFQNTGGAGPLQLTSPSAISTATWTFVRAERYGDVFLLWINDEIVVSTYSTEDTPTTSASLALRVGSNYAPGNYLNGYLENLHIAKQYARGWGQINIEWIDSSSYQRTGISAGGVYRAPEAATFGAAGLVGVGNPNQGVFIPDDNNELTPVSGDFCIDFFASCNNLSTLPSYFGHGSSTGNNLMELWPDSSGRLRFQIWDGGSIHFAGGFLTGTGVITQGQVHHILVRKRGTTWELGVDGVIEATKTLADTVPDCPGAFIIGASGIGAGSYPVDGYIDNFRFSHINRFGTSPTTYTVPVAAHSADADDVLLMHFDNIRTAVDSGNTGHTAIKASGVVFENGISPNYGTADFRFVNGTIIVSDHVDWDFGSGHWTLEVVVQADDYTLAQNQQILRKSDEAGTEQDYWELFIDTSGQVNFIYAESTIALTTLTSSALTDGVAYHIAVDADGSDIRLYVGGVVADTDTWSASISSSIDGPVRVGNNQDSSEYFIGYMDEIAISNVARYAGAFTPSLPLSGDANHKLLLHANVIDTVAVPVSSVANTDFTVFNNRTSPESGSFNLEGLTDQTDTDITINTADDANTFADGEVLKVVVGSDNADLTGGSGIIVSAVWDVTEQDRAW